ncbi:MAG TPA: catalase family peroxidase [Candidatus Methylacidiphilales bacterium]|nr:catalase family peroxidase [Candidatus Methylacidiphilales bacterium]
MPLPKDERVVALANDLLQMFDKIFGLHPGFRAAHAKGQMLTGTFTPSEQAKSLSKAPHFIRSSTPVSARFSNSTGIPVLPDNSPDANPRGLAIRFHLAEHVHTDIVSHSTDNFPARDGYEFLEFLQAVAASGPDVPSPKPVETFIATHPAALAFVQAPKPQAVSFAKYAYFGVSAFQFTNPEGKVNYGRYRIVPEGGTAFFNDEQGAALAESYHFDELAERIKAGPIRFKIVVQLAAPEDATNNPTIRWPEDRPLLDVGVLKLTALAADNVKEQKHIIFDPIPRVEGIEPSADPLFELRAAIYLLSGRRRRAA